MSEFKITYTLKTDPARITCLVCGRTSYNNNDIAYLYCGHCKAYHNIKQDKDGNILDQC